MPRVKIGVLISGSGTNLQSVIDNIESGNINGSLQVVISNREDAYGLKRARKHGIEAVYIDSKHYDSAEKYNEAVMAELKRCDVELIVLAGYLKILSKKFTESYKNRIINIHPSLIPSFCGKGYYGLKVHEAVISYGAKVSGATVHFVDENADTGPIILQEALKVNDDDTAETLQQRVLEIEHRILPLAVKYYCDRSLCINGRRVTINLK